ncbi:hypothetical protein HanXRQr2_Chr07g0307271 [Helianthus annuus]|uniref:Uncharacterized protein n=1 Tax=Helianthus annuus TaxID=4232 RepID=A0A9K3IN93_HELAN|nr:hypothetical protein HanXRQr2_Chr07g0307271 [Helianthus annuus]
MNHNAQLILLLVQTQAAFGFILFAFEYKNTPASAKPVPECVDGRNWCSEEDDR